MPVVSETQQRRGMPRAVVYITAVAAVPVLLLGLALAVRSVHLGEVTYMAYLDNESGGGGFSQGFDRVSNHNGRYLSFRIGDWALVMSAEPDSPFSW